MPTMANHRIAYRVLNRHMDDASVPSRRHVDVLATQDELAVLARDGYLVRERAIGEASLQSLRAAIDRLTEAEWPAHRPQDADARLPARSWGIVLRHLLDKDAAFHDLLAWPPAHAVDCLIYLDQLDDASGPLAVVPGSHRWLDREPPRLHYQSVPDEQTLRLPAGSLVIIHSNLWHRAWPTLTGRRRMIILAYTPVWLRKSPHGGPPPKDGLTAKLLADGDPETRELLGLAGHS